MAPQPSLTEDIGGWIAPLNSSACDFEEQLLLGWQQSRVVQGLGRIGRQPERPEHQPACIVQMGLNALAKSHFGAAMSDAMARIQSVSVSRLVARASAELDNKTVLATARQPGGRVAVRPAAQ